jgi:hypothetical protein
MRANDVPAGIKPPIQLLSPYIQRHNFPLAVPPATQFSVG